MIRPRHYLLIVACAVGIRAGTAAPAPVAGADRAPVLRPEQILGHLGRTIDWFHRVQALDAGASLDDEVVARDRLRATSTTALQLAFDFAHAAVPLVSASASAHASASASTSASTTASASASASAPAAGASHAPANAPGNAAANPAANAAANTPGDAPDSGLDRALARSAERVATLQSRLSEIDAQRAHAKGPALETLNAQREEIVAAQALARDVQATLRNLADFAARGIATGQGASGLAGQIAQLERSVPEARHTAAKRPLSSSSAASPASSDGDPAASGAPGPSASASAASAGTGVAESHDRDVAFRPESAGLIPLATQLWTLHGERADLNDLLQQTDALLKSTDALRTPLIANARDLMRQTDSINAAAHDAAEAARMRESLQNASVEFKQLSTVIVPAAEQAIATEATRATIVEWRDHLGGQLAAALRFLIFRATVLILAMSAVLLISEVWRRATFRYLHDRRRRRQFLLLRRLVVGVALTIVIVLGVVSEVGSLATYAGFVTAGIAVAMQNVILAVVAYFFLIGRYGVRVGDRITLAGVTGNVIDIGLIRIYLMELAGTDFHPTGRIVVLSNAVLFQPAALFKQVPGADYVWHVVTLTVAADADAQQVEDRLRAAADAVYRDYRPSIEQQHAALQQYVNIETLVPQPEVTVRWTPAGFEGRVRYPVEPSRASATNRQMLDALRAAIAKDPPLTLIASTGPTVE